MCFVSGKCFTSSLDSFFNGALKFINTYFYFALVLLGAIPSWGTTNVVACLTGEKTFEANYLLKNIVRITYFSKNNDLSVVG